MVVLRKPRAEPTCEPNIKHINQAGDNGDTKTQIDQRQQEILAANSKRAIAHARQRQTRYERHAIRSDEQGQLIAASVRFGQRGEVDIDAFAQAFHQYRQQRQDENNAMTSKRHRQEPARPSICCCVLAMAMSVVRDAFIVTMLPPASRPRLQDIIASSRRTR